VGGLFFSSRHHRHALGAIVRIGYKTGLALVAGLTVMGAGAQRLPAAVTVPSTDVPKPIVDLARVTSTLNFTVAGITTDVDVSNLNISHTWAGDVEISLSRPGGALMPSSAMVLIFGDCGGSDDNFTNVRISDEGVAPVCAADGLPHTGPLRGAPHGVPSANVMTAFDGVKSKGIWTLSIFDDTEGDTGTLTSWSITADFTPPLAVELAKLEAR
jgi:subtilisin-like proprotein convertase family protein